MAQKTTYYFFDLFCLNTYSIWRSDFLAKNPQLKKLPRNFHRKFQITLAKEFLEKAQNNPQIIVGDENGPPAKKVKKNRGFCKFCPKRKSLCTKVCQICSIYICGKHTHELCPKCFSESSPK